MVYLYELYLYIYIYMFIYIKFAPPKSSNPPQAHYSCGHCVAVVLLEPVQGSSWQE